MNGRIVYAYQQVCASFGFPLLGMLMSFLNLGKREMYVGDVATWPVPWVKIG